MDDPSSSPTCPTENDCRFTLRSGFYSYPDGVFHRVTNVCRQPRVAISLSADGQTIANVRTETSSRDGIDVRSRQAEHLQRSCREFLRATTSASFTWTNDGQLLISYGDRLVRQRADGSNAVKILSDPAAWISDPVSCDNDRWIAVNWMVHGEKSANRIWRANADGSDPVALTPGRIR